MRAKSVWRGDGRRRRTPDDPSSGEAHLGLPSNVYPATDWILSLQDFEGPPVYLWAAFRTLELSLQDSFQLSLTVLAIPVPASCRVPCFCFPVSVPFELKPNASDAETDVPSAWPNDPRPGGALLGRFQDVLTLIKLTTVNGPEQHYIYLLVYLPIIWCCSVTKRMRFLSSH